jgi:capsular exopolysaccharide synthesis family protein
MQSLKKKIEQLTAKVDYLIKLSGDADLASIVELRQKIAEAKDERENFKKERVAEHHKSQHPGVEKKLKNDLEKAQTNLTQLALQKQKAEEAIEEYQKSLGVSGLSGDALPPFPLIDVRERTKMITEMLDKANLLRLEVNAPPRVSDFQRASVPMKKEMKKQLFGTILAGLMGFGLVGMGVVLYEARVRRALSLADVRKAVLGPVAGVWPARTPGHGDDAIGEAVEKTRSQLLQQLDRSDGKIIAVTSALSEEGKGYLAWQLARSFARAGSRTLLIDFDLRAPSLHRWLEVENTGGVCDVLTGQVDFREVLQPRADGLTFTPAGNWTADARHGLTSERLKALMHWLRQQFDVIVLDTHPLLTVAESYLLCRYADGLLLSVERHESRLPLVARAHEKLAAATPEALGVVYQGASAEECLN